MTVRRGARPALPEFTRTLSRYRAPIVGVTLAVLAIYVIGATVYYLQAPTFKTTTLPFRLQFRGVTENQYPNGSPFSTTEITAPAVLARVHELNDIAPIMPFPAFRNSVQLLQSSEALESLVAEYRAKLSDPKLNPADRTRLEQEFRDKRLSLASSDYTLVFTTGERYSTIPETLRHKIVSDTLRIWAEQTTQTRRLHFNDVSVFTRHIFDGEATQNSNDLVTLIMLRSKMNRILSNIDTLSVVQGAKVIRTGATKASLAELRVRLEDTVNFRVEPLIGMAIGHGPIAERDDAIEFLETQLTFNRLQREEAAARVTKLREALEIYSRANQPTEATGVQGSAPVDPSVVANLGEGFINRLMDLSSDDPDLVYKQSLVDELKAASLRVVPLEAEGKYYETMLQTSRSVNLQSRRPAPADAVMIRSQIEQSRNEAIKITDEVNEIYTTMAKHLNPSAEFFTLTAPSKTKVERGANPSILVWGGLLLLFITVPFVLLSCLIHARLGTPDLGEVAADDLELARSSSTHAAGASSA